MDVRWESSVFEAEGQVWSGWFTLELHKRNAERLLVYTYVHSPRNCSSSKLDAVKYCRKHYRAVQLSAVEC